MEKYYEEAGWAGRDGLPSEAIVHYNCPDISKAKLSLQDTMIKFIKSTTKCKCKLILQYFGYSAPKRNDGGHSCCDYNRSICTCELCKTLIEIGVATVAIKFNTSGALSFISCMILLHLTPSRAPTELSFQTDGSPWHLMHNSWHWLSICWSKWSLIALFMLSTLRSSLAMSLGFPYCTDFKRFEMTTFGMASVNDYFGEQGKKTFTWSWLKF